MNNNTSLLLKLMLTALLMITAITNTTVKAEKHIYTEKSQHKEMLQRYSIILGTWTSDLGEGYSQNLIIDKDNVTERITDPNGQVIESETKSSPYAFEWDDVSNELFIKTLIAKYRIDNDGVYAKKDGVWKPFKKISNTSTSSKPSKSKPQGKEKTKTHKTKEHPIGLDAHLTHHLEGHMIINQKTKSFITLDFTCDNGTIRDIVYSYPAGNKGVGSTFNMDCQKFDSKKSTITFFGKDDQGSDFTLELKYDKQGNFTGTAYVGKHKGLKVELKCKRDMAVPSHGYATKSVPTPNSTSTSTSNVSTNTSSNFNHDHLMDNNRVHPIGMNSYLTHHLEGVMVHTIGENKGKENAITLDFTCDNGVISNVIYNYPGGHAKLELECTYFDSSSISFFRKSKKGDFYLKLYYDNNSRQFNGKATVGANELDVFLTATCNHF